MERPRSLDEAIFRVLVLPSCLPEAVSKAIEVRQLYQQFQTSIVGPGEDNEHKSQKSCHASGAKSASF